MRTLAIGLLAVCLAGATTVTGPVYTPNTASPFTGTLEICPSTSWINTGGKVVAKVCVTATVTAGVFSVSLEPTDTATQPSGPYYTFTFRAAGQRSYAVNYQVQTSVASVSVAELTLVSTLPAATYAYVPTSRTISTTTPLGGGGALSGNLTLTCSTCVVTSGSYANPSWLTSIGFSKLATASSATANYNSYAYYFDAPSFTHTSQDNYTSWQFNQGNFPVASYRSSAYTLVPHVSSVMRITERSSEAGTIPNGLEIYQGLESTTNGGNGLYVQSTLHSAGVPYQGGVNAHCSGSDTIKPAESSNRYWATNTHCIEVDVDHVDETNAGAGGSQTTRAVYAACTNCLISARTYAHAFVADMNNTRITTGVGPTNNHGFATAFRSLPGAAQTGLDLWPTKNATFTPDASAPQSASQAVRMTAYTDNSATTATGYLDIGSSGIYRLRATETNRVMSLNQGGTALSPFQSQLYNAATTNGATLTNTEMGGVITNAGATGSVSFTLPTPAAGLPIWVSVQASQTLTITAPGSVTIRDGTTVTGAGGSISSQVLGSWVYLVGVSTTSYMVAAKNGRWSSDGQLLPDQVLHGCSATTADGLAYGCSMSGMLSLPAYTAFVIVPAATNAGATTLALNGGTAVPVKTHGGQAIATGELLIDRPYWVIYDSANQYYRLLPRNLLVPTSTGLVAYRGATGAATSAVTITAGNGITVTDGGGQSGNPTIALSYPATTNVTAVSSTATSGGSAIALQAITIPSGWISAGRSVQISGGGAYDQAAGTGVTPTISVLVCDSSNCTGSVSATVMACTFAAAAAGATAQPWRFDLDIGVAATGAGGSVRSSGTCNALVNSSYASRVSGSQAVSVDLSGGTYYLVTRWNAGAGGNDQTPTQWISRAVWGQ